MATINVRMSDLRVGDRVPPMSDIHGPVVDVRRYRCGPDCAQCDGAQCVFKQDWLVYRLHSGWESTLSSAWITVERGVS